MPTLSRDDVHIGPVEKGVAIPPKNGGGGNEERSLGRWGLAFVDLKPGDSRLFRPPAGCTLPRSVLANMVTGAATRYLGPGCFTTRSTAEGVRLWRLPPAEPGADDPRDRRLTASYGNPTETGDEHGR